MKIANGTIVLEVSIQSDDVYEKISELGDLTLNCEETIKFKDLEGNEVEFEIHDFYIEWDHEIINKGIAIREEKKPLHK